MSITLILPRLKDIVHFDLWLYIRSHSSSSMISVHLTVGLSEYDNFPKRKRQWTKHSKNKKCSFNLQLKCIFQKWKINFCFKHLNRAWPWRMSYLVSKVTFPPPKKKIIERTFYGTEYSQNKEMSIHDSFLVSLVHFVSS